MGASADIFTSGRLAVVLFLILLGVLILTRRFTVLSSYLGFLNRFTL